MDNYAQDISFLDAESEVPEAELYEGSKSVVVHFKFKEEVNVVSVKSLLSDRLSDKFRVFSYEGSETEEEDEIKLLVVER